MSKRCLGCMELFGDEFEICPHCGYAVGTRAEEAIHIEPGTLLQDRYIIGKVLGYGGFGVTYIGWDGKLEQKVAIKEYLPGEFSTRMPGQTQVTVFNGDKSEQFHDGLKKFVEEAKRLAKFQNEPGIVKIFDSFEENETAYIIMEYLDGETLASYLKKEKTIPEEDAVRMMMPVMESLQVVHAAGMLHRDIAPDNIFLTKTGEVKLIDFGASRYATTSHSRSLTVIIKPGYSPEEQYRSRGDQGTYTDVYAVAATLYKMMTGKTPPDAMERRAKYESKSKDILVEPHKINKNISLRRENAILNAMNVRIEDRTPDIKSFMSELNAESPVKRRYGKIKKVNLYAWPLWLKIAVPAAASLIILFAVLLATGVIRFRSLFSDEIIIPDGIVMVPDVEGMDMEEAVEMLKKGKLNPSSNGNITSDYIEAGKIILQSPVGNSYLNENGTVLLTVSSGANHSGGGEEGGEPIPPDENGLVTVPYVIWKPEDEAKEMLRQNGLGEPIIERQYDATVTEGCVIKQSIQDGDKAEAGTVLTLTVSLGPAPFEMPNVVGLEKEAAKDTLQKLGLSVIFEYRKDDNVKENTVIQSSKEAGAQVKRGDQVVLTVSSGVDTVTVASVVGMTKKDASSALKKQGFDVVVLENYDANVPSGNVISQTPAAGSEQLPGSKITVMVSKGKQPVDVNLDANGGEVSKKKITVYVTGTYGSLPEATRSGYTFDGWYTAVNGGTKIDGDTRVESGAIQTLYAHWTAKRYKVSFDVNGGSGTVPSQDVTYGAEYGSLPTPNDRPGYAFVGWYTAASGGTKVDASSLYTTAENQTLYAHWSNNAYTVTFNVNGGPGQVQSQNIEFGAEYGTLPTPDERAGYTFAGWYTAASGGTEITASTKFTTASNQTLYAHWTANTYTVNFKTNGGPGSVSSRQVKYDTAYGSLPTPPARTGYTFDGWFTAASGGTEIKETTRYTETTDQTLYAHWTAKRYTVSFNVNGGTGSVRSVQVTYDAAYGKLPTPNERPGYTFDGWYTEANGGTKIIETTKYTNDSDQTLYAHWKAKSYTVSFDVNGGSGTIPSRKVTYGAEYGAENGKLPVPNERVGYTFDGWYTAASGGTKIVETTRYTETTDQTLYAHWTAKSYTVSFDVNGGSGTVPSRKVTYDAAYGSLPTPNERPGYTFDGWYTAASGGTEIKETTKYTNTSDQTLYAHWTAKSYTVSFDVNGGSGTIPSRKVTYDAAYGSLPTPDERRGYTFDGWYTAASGGTRITEKTTYTETSDQTLYAHWSAAKYTVSFDLNGAGGSIDSRQVTFDSTYGDLPTPSRDYYSFIGWFTEKEEGRLVTPTTKVTTASPHTLYAHWAHNAVSDWVEKSQIPAGAEIVEKKMQFRYQERIWKESHSKYESGWTLDSSKTSYGPWSEWKEGKYSQTDDIEREVETATVYGWYYFLCPQCGFHSETTTCYRYKGGCGYTMSSADFRQYWLTANWNLAKPTDTGRYYYDDSQYKRVFRWDDGGSARPGFRTRVITYKFYKWLDWTSWSDMPTPPYGAKDDRREETRTLYKYRAK